MREKCYTNPLRGGASILWKGIRSLLVIAAIFSASSIFAAGTPKFPFPQNYKYPYGVLPANYKNFNNELVAKYNQFMGEYYEEGLIDGVPCGRLRFYQPGETGDATVSEGIGYGMLMTVYMAGTNGVQEYDRFNRLWNYYKKNSNANGIMNWKVDKFTGKPMGNLPENANGATDAELDVAQALLMAYKQWGDQSFYNDAIKLMSTIWAKEVDYQFVLKPGDAFDDYKNPCYFVTNAMQLFANVDPNKSNQWTKAIDASYALTTKVQNKTTGLVPDWVRPDGSYISGIEGGKFSSHYLYDAIRVQWRMAQAYSWFGHPQAKQISSLVTTWAVSKSGGEPKNMLDGYTLSGGDPNDPSIPYFKGKGQWPNACFTGGFAAGGMVDANFQAFIDRGYSALGTSYSGISSYFVDATHILYMMYMSGNMPNLYDMLPEFVAAETNDDGSAILVKFSKELNTTTVANSLAGWSVKSDFGKVTNTITSVEAIDAVTVKLTFDQVIEDEYQIVSYNGAAGLKSIEGSNLNIFSSDLSVLDNTALANYRAVTDLRLNKRPIITQAVTNLDGNKIFLLFDQNLAATTVTSTGFTLTADGTAKTISSASFDPAEPKKMVLIVGTNDYTTWIGEGQSLLLSYAGTRLASEIRQRVKVFTNRIVRNNTVVQKCKEISTFESSATPGGAWITSFLVSEGETWKETTANPKPTSTVNITTTCVEYVRTAGSDVNSAPNFKFNINMHESSAINSLLKEGQTLFTFKLYAPNCAGSKIKIAFYDNANATWWESPYLDYSYTIPTAATTDWVDVSVNMENDKDFKGVVNTFEIAVDKGAAGKGQKVYLDEFKLCSPIPSTEIRGAMVNYDGKSFTLTFGNDMNIPDNPADFKFGVKSATSVTYQDATSVVVDPNNTRKLIFGTPFIVGSTQKDLVVKYEPGTAVSLDGRALVPFMDYPVVNAVNRVITRGWRDDFEDKSDFVTKSLGQTDSDFTKNENTDGTFSVTANAATSWKSFSVTVMDELWDLSKNQTVTVRVKSASPFYLRVDMKDLTNDRNTDMVEVQKYTGSDTWQEMVFDITGLWKNVYTAPGAVNSEAIYQVLFYPWSELSNAANSYSPPTYTKKIDIDYIAIGASVVVSCNAVAPAGSDTKAIDAGKSAKGWTSADNAVIYTVPVATPRSLASLDAAVKDGLGAKVSAPVKKTEYDLGQSALPAGSYAIYAYEPATGAISIKMDLTLVDVTPPVFTYSLPNLTNVFELNSVAQVKMNEPGFVVMIAGDIDPTTLTGNQLVSSTYAKALLQIKPEDINQFKGLILKPTSTNVGYKLVAVDMKGLLSEITPKFTVQDTRPPVVTVSTTNVPWILATATNTDDECAKINDEGEPIIESDIKFTVNKAGVGFMVPAGTTSQFIKTATSTSPGVISSLSALSTTIANVFTTAAIADWNCYEGTDYRPGEYWIYARDASGNVSEPASVYIGDIVLNGVASVTISPSAPAAITTSNGTRALSLSIVGIDATKPANVTSTVWTSDKPAIASVAGTATSATITAVGNGTARITVTVTDALGNTKTAYVDIIVNIPIEPASITVTSGITMNLIASQEAAITASILPLGASQDFSLSTTSSDITIVGTSIIAGNVSTAKVAQVTVYSTSKPSISQIVTVNIAPPTKPVVSLDPSTAQTMKVGEVLVLKAMVSNATDTRVTWSSSLTNVASVTAGTVSASFPGATVITATSMEDVSSSATVSITVVKKAPSALTLDVDKLTFIANSTSSQTLTASFGGTDDASTTDLGLTWSSSNPLVATVDANGKVTLATGATAGQTAVITAKSTANPTLEDYATVNISSNEVLVTGIEVTPTLTLGISQTGKIQFAYTPSSTTQTGVSYSSSNPSVLNVDPVSGTYDALKAGFATVTVTSTVNTSISAQIAVTVEAAKIQTVTITSPVNGTLNLDMKTNTTASITASYSPSYATNDLVYNVISGTAVTVSPTGLVTAASAGTATVRVSSASNSAAYADVTVSVADDIVPVDNVSLTNGFSTLVRIGDVVNLTNYITVNPGNATNQNVTLISSPASAVTITGTYFMVNSSATGTFTITVKSNADATKFATATFTVIAPVTEVVISGESEVVAGGTLTFTATVTGGSDLGVTWESAVSGITVSSTGIVSVASSVTPGTYSVKAISVENNSIFGTKSFTVVAQTGTLTSIVLPSTLSVKKGETITVSATTDPLSYTGLASWNIVSGTGSLSASTGKTVMYTAGMTIGITKVTMTMAGIVSNECVISIVEDIKPITGVTLIQSLPTSIDAGTTINLSTYFSKQPADADENLTYSVAGGTLSGTVVTAGASGNVVVTVKYPAKPAGTDYIIAINAETVLLQDIILTGANSDVIVAKNVTSSEITVSSTNAELATSTAVAVSIEDATVADLIITGQGMNTVIKVKGLTPGFKTTVTVKAVVGTATKTFNVIVPLDTVALSTTITEINAKKTAIYSSLSKAQQSEFLAALAEAKKIIADAKINDFSTYSQADVTAFTAKLNAYLNGTPDASVSISIVLAPVPVKDLLFVTGAEVISISIADMKGNVIIEAKGAEVNTSALTTGEYVVTVVTADGTIIEKVIK